MNMMYFHGPSMGFPFLVGIHMLAALAFLIGLVFCIALALKRLNDAQLKNWAIGLIIGGLLVCLFTMKLMTHTGFGTGMRTFNTRMPMMGQEFGAVEQGDKSADQVKEEAEGKALFDQLKAKQTTCAKLSDADFELIGEYVMGQRTGVSHEQMNDMLKQMMGDIGEEQMHIVLAKSATGCAPAGQMGGMMMK